MKKSNLFISAFTLSNNENAFPMFVLFLFDDKESPVAIKIE